VRLSYDLFRQIITGLKADTRQIKDNRGEPRVGISCDATVVSGRTSTPAPGQLKTSRIQIRDLSCTGVGLLMNASVAKGQKFIIELPSNDGLCWLMCTAVHCLQLDEKVYRVGANHTRVLEPAEVKTLAGQLMSAPTAAQRGEMQRIRIAMLG
jgi:hypothetical protein